MKPYFNRYLAIRTNLQFFQKVEAFLKHRNVLLNDFFKMLRIMKNFKDNKYILFAFLKYIMLIFH